MGNKLSNMEIARKRVRHWNSGPLDLSGLRLTELPELPVDLTSLMCNNNQLISLPKLPASLKKLNCSMR